ncbi:MAG: hypothetical protein Q9213_002669 [Squamulea squamosa]
MAVDFGTTFSGLAWAHTGKPDAHLPVIQWPDATSGGLEGETSDKVPTESRYDDDGYKWGFQIGDTGQRHQWFKLGLDPLQSRTSTLATTYPDPKAAPPAYGRSHGELTRDYLKALKNHAERILRHQLPASALASTPIVFVITVPAIWSDRAKAAMRRCAEQAGMGTGSGIHMVTEPEAAATYALQALDPHSTKIGDTFVLCDAGGGTVDLISYTVTALKPLLRVKEAAPGTGSLCGSTFLNRIFHDFLVRRLGDDPDWEFEQDEVLEEAMKRFDITVKRSFNGNPADRYPIPVPGLKDSLTRGIDHHKLHLTGSDIRKIFDPVVGEVVALINGQIKATKLPVKAVLMVGGFSRNVYLRESIRQAVASRNIEVLQSPNALVKFIVDHCTISDLYSWTATVRGALIKAFASTNPNSTSVMISGRSARKHYGVASSKKFNPSVHGLNKGYWSNFHGCYRVETMDWFIQKVRGDTVKEHKPKQLPYVRYFLATEALPTSIKDSVYACIDNDDVGPPTYPKDHGVRKLVIVTADLSRIPLHTLPKIIGADNMVYYEFGFHIEVTYYSAYTKYEMVHSGTNYGPVIAEYV